MSHYALIAVIKGLDEQVFFKRFGVSLDQHCGEGLRYLQQFGLVAFSKGIWKFSGKWEVRRVREYFALSRVLFGEDLLLRLRTRFLNQYDPRQDYSGGSSLLKAYADRFFDDFVLPWVSKVCCFLRQVSYGTGMYRYLLIDVILADNTRPACCHPQLIRYIAGGVVLALAQKGLDVRCVDLMSEREGNSSVRAGQNSADVCCYAVFFGNKVNAFRHMTDARRSQKSAAPYYCFWDLCVGISRRGPFKGIGGYGGDP